MSEPHADPGPSDAAAVGAETSSVKAAAETALTEDLLLARFQERPLAALIEAAIDGRSLAAIAPRLGLSPLPGKRLKTMRAADHARLLARNSLEHEKVRKAVLEELGRGLPAPLFAGADGLAAAEVERWLGMGARLDLATRLGLVLSLLPAAEHAPRLMQAIEDGLLARGEEPGPTTVDPVAQLEARAAKAEHRAERAEQAAKAEVKAVEARETSLKQRIEGLNAELNELRQRAGEKNREFEQMKEHVERLKEDLQVAFRRAARFKHALDDTKSASERERELKEAYARERQRAEIEQSKVEILEYQLDLMELEDDDEKAGKTVADDPTPRMVADYIAKHGRAPRLLIVGGAGKQRSHKERDFAEFKRRLGVEGEWRFAEYGSWHRDLPRLRNDIRDRYDLVFVLHWNRTTFVQKMHDEARALNGRVRTVPYRGFLSLERAVSEELQRFIRENT